jgi:hypothetical protein
VSPANLSPNAIDHHGRLSLILQGIDVLNWPRQVSRQQESGAEQSIGDLESRANGQRSG